jgi:cytochrome c oxidase cbb3-type subunit 3
MSTPEHRTPDAEQQGSALYGRTHDQVIQGHKYDGIKEYDNPMPGWWVWLFYVCIVFAVVYFVGITFFDFVDTYEDDLAQSQAELELIREAYAEANPSFTPDAASLAALADDPAAVEAGAATYAAVCAACHGAEAQGVIGPNLTDDYWLHGGSNMAIFEILKTGVTAKGMPAWESNLSAEERAQLVAFIRSVQGTEPAGAKEPQGELYEEGA